MPSRAIIVDDDSVNLYYAGKILRSHGYETVATDGYLTALEALTGTPSDVLVADIRLGKSGSGLELARMARKRQPTLKILLMTAYREEELNAKHAGFPIIRVPFTSRGFLTEIRNL